MEASRNFSMDSKLTGNGRDAPATQVPHLFRSRMCIVCWLPLISLSCQLWGFYTWKLDKSFPSGLEKFATCMDGKREEAKGDSRVNDEPLTSWRVVFTFLHSRNVKLQSDEIGWWRKLERVAENLTKMASSPSPSCWSWSWPHITTQKLIWELSTRTNIFVTVFVALLVWCL